MSKVSPTLTRFAIEPASIIALSTPTTVILALAVKPPYETVKDVSPSFDVSTRLIVTLAMPRMVKVSSS